MGAKYPFARGWFVLAWSGELAPGDVQPVQAWGRELALFRGEDGGVGLLDAHCPHLGAHLGHGGKVCGSSVVCPFHAWAFDATGACTDIPYAEKMPKRAATRSWPVVERNGAIFGWHDPASGPPTWDVPVIPEHGADGWTDWATNSLEVKTSPREIVENVADKAHFPIVHGTHVDRFDNVYQDHKATQLTEGVAYPRGGGEDRFKLDATYHGPAFQITDMKGFLDSRLLLAHTPIDEGRLILRFGVLLQETGSAARDQAFAAGYVDNLTTGFHEDIEIWENKTWRDRPAICDGDGPIGRLRTWYRQFFEEQA